MPATRRALTTLAAALPLVAWSQAAPAPNPLDPIAHWVGGEWVSTAAPTGGRKVTLLRTYEWSFDRRLIIGRSFAETDGQRRQSRATIFHWNPDTRRIEFTDHIDQGGHGAGFVELRDGKLYMDVRIVGNAKHPPWRAWITESGDDQTIQIEALKDGQWVDFGRHPYRRQR